MLAPIEGEMSRYWGTRATVQEEVQIVPLDDLAASDSLPHPDLVKIDAQGYEGHVLAGGKKTLAHAQRIVIEVSLKAIYDGQVLLPEILQAFSGLGFEVEDINETLRQWPGPLWQVDLWLKR